MKNRGLRLGGMLLAMAMTAALGCESPPTNTQEHIGDSYREAKRLMIASNKDEDGMTKTPLEMHGDTAAGVLENYRESEKRINQIDRGRSSGIVKVSENK
jgi:hypothetical protein